MSSYTPLCFFQSYAQTVNISQSSTFWSHMFVLNCANQICHRFLENALSAWDISINTVINSGRNQVGTSWLLRNYCPTSSRADKITFAALNWRCYHEKQLTQWMIRIHLLASRASTNAQLLKAIFVLYWIVLSNKGGLPLIGLCQQ